MELEDLVMINPYDLDNIIASETAPNIVKGNGMIFKYDNKNTYGIVVFERGKTIWMLKGTDIVKVDRTKILCNVYSKYGENGIQYVKKENYKF